MRNRSLSFFLALSLSSSIFSFAWNLFLLIMLSSTKQRQSQSSSERRRSSKSEEIRINQKSKADLLWLSYLMIKIFSLRCLSQKLLLIIKRWVIARVIESYLNFLSEQLRIVLRTAELSSLHSSCSRKSPLVTMLWIPSLIKIKIFDNSFTHNSAKLIQLRFGNPSKASYGIDSNRFLFKFGHVLKLSATPLTQKVLLLAISLRLKSFSHERWTKESSPGLVHLITRRRNALVIIVL